MSKAFLRVEGVYEVAGASSTIKQYVLPLRLNCADESSLKYYITTQYGNAYTSRANHGYSLDLCRLTQLGFNTVGWPQEYVGGEALKWYGEPIDLQHTLYPWSWEELQSTGMSIAVQLYVIEIED